MSGTQESKIIELEVFKNNLREYLRKYRGVSIDLDNPSHDKFLRQFAGAIMFLIPEASGFLVENGLPDDAEMSFLTMAALGMTLKELGDKGLNVINKSQGEYDEKLNDVIKSASNSGKLWN